MLHIKQHLTKIITNELKLKLETIDYLTKFEKK